VTHTLEALDQFTQALGPILSLPALSPAPPHPPEPAGAAAPAAPVRPAAAVGQQRVAMSRDGITRQAPRGGWARRAWRVVLALTLALGFSRAVRATERAADRYCRQTVAMSLAAQQHGHRMPAVRHPPPIPPSASRRCPSNAILRHR
jgi:hypothetical protein